ncbi:MAG: SMC-Scp complex subunit ScpB [Candidatus Omnitrophica bacterium]|nr:SMC-Scp complex subunit ScpB [Candidatus Omnitrophota bacterium]
MEGSTNDYLKGAIEALLFVSDKPVTLEQLKEAIDSVEAGEIRGLIQQLKAEYEEEKRGMMIVEIAGGYQMLSSPSFAAFIRNFFKKRVKEKLSRPGLETLAIVAYKQPVSRSDVEVIRGVNSDGVVTNLLDKGLIKVVGRKDVPGRPYLYGTTKQFLEYFGLKTLKDMPKLGSISSMIEQTQEKDMLPIEGDQPVSEGTEVAEQETVVCEDVVHESLPTEQTQQEQEPALKISTEEEVKVSEDVVPAEETEVEEAEGEQAEEPKEEISQDKEEEERLAVEEATRLKEAMDDVNQGKISLEPEEGQPSEDAGSEESEEFSSAESVSHEA